MKFLVTCDVTDARGTQTWTVEAENEDEALKKWTEGDANFDSEEIEVMSLGEPHIELL